MRYVVRPFHSDPRLWLLLTVVVSLALLAGCDKRNSTSVNPEDPLLEQRRYYPLTEGSEWEYIYADIASYTYTIVNSYNGVFGDSADIREEGEGQQRFISAWWDNDQLIVQDLDRMGVPIVYLDLPLELGHTWSAYDDSHDNVTDRADSRIVAVDSVITVPAGTFPAVIVREIHYYTNVEDVLTDTLYNAFALDVGRLFIQNNGWKYVLNSYSIP